MQPAFLLRTTLAPDQQRTNFTLIDNPVIDLLTSAEAESACSKMFLIYTRLKRADWRFFERPGVLNIKGNGTQTAWQILCELAGVAPATLNKAIKWMKEHHVIGYWSGKNGAGIRIFFNVAAASVKPREQKNLRLVSASPDALPTSAVEAPFKESGPFIEIQNSDLDGAPKAALASLESVTTPAARKSEPTPPAAPVRLTLVPPLTTMPSAETLTDQLTKLERLLPHLKTTVPDRDWLEKAGLPKIARVAVAEAMRATKSRPASNAYVGAAPHVVETKSPTALPPEHSDFYRNVLTQLTPHLPAQALECWFAPLNMIELGSVKVIRAPDEVFQQWLESNYAELRAEVGLNDCQWEFVNERNERCISSK